MLVLRSHCSSNLHHSLIRKLGGREASIDLKHALYVCTAFSADRQCLPGAEYYKLVFLACDEVLNFSGCFIVHYVEGWLVASYLAPTVHSFVGCQQIRLVSRLHWDALDKVWIVYIKNNYVLVSVVGHPWKPPCLVAGNPPVG